MRGKIRYQKELQKTYVVVQEISRELLDGYGGQMVLHSRLRGLAVCEVQLIDGRREVRYDVSFLQTIEQAFAVKEMKRQDLQKLLEQIIQVIREAEGYLLDARRLCFLPEYLYWNMETEQLQVLFDYTEQPEDNGMRQLAEFLLERTCHEDDKAVELTYFFFECVQKENLSVEVLEAWIERWVLPESRGMGTSAPERAQSESKVPEGMLPESSTIRHSKRIFWGSGRLGKLLEGGLAAIITAVLLGIAFFVIRAYFFLTFVEEWLWIGLSVGLLLAGVGLSVWGIVQEHRKEPTKGEAESGTGKEDFSEAVWWESEKGENTAEQMPEPADGKTVYIGDSVWNREYKLVQLQRGMEKEYSVTGYPFLIGKDKERVNLQIKEHSVSRIHARLLEENGDIYIEDLHSTNGTYLNDLLLAPHQPMRLRRGDLVQFGRAEYAFR